MENSVSSPVSWRLILQSQKSSLWTCYLAEDETCFFISLFKRQQRNRCVWIQLKGPILPKCNDLTGAMKCNKETIFYLLMPSYKSGTWIGQVLKKTPAPPRNAAGMNVSPSLRNTLLGDAKYVLVSQWQEEPPSSFSPMKASEAGEEAAAEKWTLVRRTNPLKFDVPPGLSHQHW